MWEPLDKIPDVRDGLTRKERVVLYVLNDTLVDLAVVDPATHSLVLRAGGFDTSTSMAHS
jgi:hypothetical protein